MARCGCPPALDQSHEVLFFISSRTGMQVKRPAVGAEGYVLNHLDATATEHYLKNVGDRLMQAFPSDRPYAVFCDSLEVYNQDWTPDFLEEFQKRRGYDLKPYLPALIADVGPKTLDIRRDWGKTLDRTLQRTFPGAAARLGQTQSHATARAELWNSRGFAFRIRECRSA